MTPADALKLAEQSGAKMVDFKFVDLLGIWQHTTMPISKLGVEVGGLQVADLADQVGGQITAR